MHRRPVTTLLALCGIGGLVAAIVGGGLLRDEAQVPSSAKPARPPVQRETAPGETRHSPRSQDPGKPGETPPPQTGAIDPRATALRAAALASTLKDYPARVDLERRAALVEREANDELQRLVPLLDLTPEQEQRVFKALVRSSSNFTPGMRVGDEALAAGPAESSEAVLAELSETQAAEYNQDTEDRAAWWQDYLNTVATRMEAETPLSGSGGDSAAPASPGSVPEVLPAKESRVSNGEE